MQQFYDVDAPATRLTVHYLIGTEARSVDVDPVGATLEEHIDRLEELAVTARGGLLFVPWRLPGAGTIAIRLDSIVALTAR